MSTATEGTKTSAVDTSFLRSRLGSFLAVVPLSFWVALHLWNNLAAFKGGAAWQHAVTEYDHPLAFFAASLVALLPIAVHSIWGIARLFTVRPNNVQYRFFSNLKYALQRLSAIGLLLFLGAHLWLAFLKPYTSTGKSEPFADIAHEMHHHGPTLAVYCLGVLGTAYHLANGLHTFAMGWGIVSSRRALKKLEIGVWVIFLALLAMGFGGIYALYEAGT